MIRSHTKHFVGHAAFKSGTTNFQSGAVSIVDVAKALNMIDEEFKESVH